MQKTRNVLIVLGMLMAPAAPAAVQVSIGIGLPHASIGIYLPAYPQLVVVPGYPVYYAPSWWYVEPYAVPIYVLRVPVRYYRQPPAYFRGWRPDAPPRWSNHWGREWEHRRQGWDKWDRRAVPPPAPLPAYQKKYSGERYPRQIEQQHELQQQRYRYQPRDPVVREQYQERYQKRVAPPSPVRDNNQRANDGRDSRQQDMQRPAPRPQENPRSQPQQRMDERVRMPVPAAPHERSPREGDSTQQPAASQERMEQPQNRDADREQKQYPRQEKERERNN
ncbi:MAG: hypothetical protein B7X81_00340 [Hydrogenophilales bacterium 17-61-76]|nr:MAG: hypothetical protein B7X81_00340 [Hydrogenophilales bacterium 17-61-76]